MAVESHSFELHGTVDEVAGREIIRFDEASSAQLPSRGQVAVDTEIKGEPTTLVIEPDGRRGHWLPVPAALRGSVQSGDPVSLPASVSKVWPEVELPEDLSDALKQADDLAETWTSLTPMARWEWVRWVGATKNEQTRERRVEVSISKLRDGKRRPCCFDLSSCTDPEVAKSGKLIE